MTDQLPVRYCHGCRTYDDHPRILAIADQNDAATDKLFHYDCAPVSVITPELEPILAARHSATDMVGDKLREVATAHAQSLVDVAADSAHLLGKG